MIADEEYAGHVNLVVTRVALAIEVEDEIILLLRNDDLAQLGPVGGVLRYHAAVRLQEAILAPEASKDVVTHRAQCRRPGARERACAVCMSVPPPRECVKQARTSHTDSA